MQDDIESLKQVLNQCREREQVLVEKEALTIAKEDFTLKQEKKNWILIANLRRELIESQAQDQVGSLRKAKASRKAKKTMFGN